MPSKKILELPSKIKVGIFKSVMGTYIAELPEYDLHTEADTIEELAFNINDLIYAYFDVDKEYQKDIWYRPLDGTNRVSQEKSVPLIFQKLLPEFNQKY